MDGMYNRLIGAAGLRGIEVDIVFPIRVGYEPVAFVSIPIMVFLTEISSYLRY